MRPGAGRIVCGWGLWISGLVFISLCLASVTLATTLRRMDLPEMVAVADRVVHARVVGSRVYWAEPGQILTDTTFEVLRDIMGSGPKMLTITQLGGRIDPVELVVEGTPTFSEGEEVVLLTELTPSGRRVIVGLSQGVMRVHVDAETSEKVVLSEADPDGLTFIGSRLQPSEVRLETLIGDIRRLAEAAARPKAPEEVRP